MYKLEKARGSDGISLLCYLPRTMEGNIFSQESLVHEGKEYPWSLVPGLFLDVPLDLLSLVLWCGGSIPGQNWGHPLDRTKTGLGGQDRSRVYRFATPRAVRLLWSLVDDFLILFALWLSKCTNGIFALRFFTNRTNRTEQNRTEQTTETIHVSKI